jgi:hypothetical protein
MTAARIVVVEDESIVAKDIQNSLRKMGYEVPAVVPSGEEALARLPEAAPDLVLMDIMLKGPMDGIETAEAIRTRFGTPVVYLTAYTDDSTLKRAKVSDAFGYLLKPFEDRELRITIEMALYKHQMERRLRESQEWLATTLHAIGEGVIAADIAGRIKFINPVAQAATGWTEEEAIGRALPEVFDARVPAGASGLAALVEQVAGSAAPAALPPDSRLAARGGPEILVEAALSPMRDSEGGLVGLVLVFRDITERRQSELREREMSERLVRAKRMESLGVLAGGIAHDLNNILGPIVGYPDLIIRNLPPDSPVREDLEIIKNSARKAVDIIRDLLTLGRIGHYPMEPLDLNAVVRACSSSATFLLLREKNALVVVETRLQERLPPVVGSEPHLMQMVLNLAMNAFEAMPDGGTLAIETSDRTVTEPFAGFAETVEKGRYVLLEVRDTGRGIDPQIISRIFEPFFTQKRMGSAGSGLGLAVVYGVVKDHKGFVDVLSEPGKGTAFRLYLPASAKTIEVSTRDEVEYRGTESVLVVDDDEEQRKFAVRLLQTLGYTVESAADGQAAVDRVREAVAAGRPGPALMLLDMIMAHDLDGLDTYRRLIEIVPGQKAIIVSGFSVTDRIKEALSLGVGQFIQKPFTVEELGKAIRRELDRKPGAD